MTAVKLAAFVLLSSGLSGAAAAETVTYTYDAKGRVVRVVKVDDKFASVTTDLSHDRADNRTRVVKVAVPR